MRSSIRRPTITLPRHGGAVIIVVLSLLSLMLFLGIFFFEYAQEEQQTSENFAGANEAEVIDPEPFFQEGLEQLIVGPRTERVFSVLRNADQRLDHYNPPPAPPTVYPYPYGQVHSMLSHTIGPINSNHRPLDVIPHNGTGIQPLYVDLSSPADGIPDIIRFDHDGDGIADSTLDPAFEAGFSPVPLPDPRTGAPLPGFALNYSPLAQLDPTTDAFNQSVPAQWTAAILPDTDYTQADLNTPFLAHEEIFDGRRVLVPSFHRPILFPTRRDTDGIGPNTSLGFADIYTNPATRRMVMRPHSDHLYNRAVPPVSAPNLYQRYLTGAVTAQSGDTGRLIGAFLFTNDSDQDGTLNEMGMYSNPNGFIDPPNPTSNDPTQHSHYELDVDADGDGKLDSIWIDPGLGLYELGDGRQYVPLFAYYVLDADGLLNLNVHGNLQGLSELGQVYNYASPTPADFLSLSLSNHGLSPSEVNFARALTGDLAGYTGSELQRVQTELAYNFGFPAGTAQARQVIANMEQMTLTTGRLRAGSGSPLGGRHGEEELLVDALPELPQAGNTANIPIDDDGDASDGGKSLSEDIYEPGTNGGTITLELPAFVHPISLSGAGADAVSMATGTEVRDAQQRDGTTPAIFPTYLNHYVDPTPSSAGEDTYSSLPNTLLDNVANDRINEENELIVSHNSRNPRIDSPFSPTENVFLQVSDQDYLRSNARTRLDLLAPINFRSARDARSIRQRFTTDSWDLNDLGYAFHSQYRPNEVSTWNGASLFPPEFGGATAFSATDPIRPALRKLLASYASTNSSNIGSNRTLWRQKLNLNRLLVGFDDEADPLAMPVSPDTDGSPLYRNLVPHPDVVELENQQGGLMPAITIPVMIHNNGAAPPVPLTNILATPGTDAQRVSTTIAQEWWARYDRQRLARDMYTLLYLLGGTSVDDPSGAPYATAIRGSTPASSSTVPANVEEMAQFAVNYVDALDRDDVITKFEYDADLSDGWNNPSESAFGVERQSLTISEALLLQLQRKDPATGTDFAATLHTEDDDTHSVLHIELRNTSPFQVDVAEGWRVVRMEKNTVRGQYAYRFQTPGLAAGQATSAPKGVACGENFLISCHDDLLTSPNGVTTSDIYINIDGDAELERIVPSGGDNGADTLPDNQASPADVQPAADIDLSITGMFNHDNYHEEHVPSGPPVTIPYTSTALLETTTMGDATPVSFDLVLQRRQNLRGLSVSAISDADSDSAGKWIEVDRFAIDSTAMNSVIDPDPSMDNAGGMVAELADYNSHERPQPFHAEQKDGPTAGIRNHTISAIPASKHAVNDSLTSMQFTIWQPHFDRDFTSIYELLSVPLYGNHSIADIAADYTSTYDFIPEIHGGAVYHLARGDTSVAGGVSLAGDYSSGVRFLFPNGVPTKPYFGWNSWNYENNWYRLFEMIQVPRRTEQSTEVKYTVAGQTVPPMLRTPGKINLNTIRDETVLAALLDDDIHFPYTQTDTTYGITDDDLEAADARNWYRELRQSRDGVDSFFDPALTTATIPGTLSPFVDTSPPLVPPRGGVATFRPHPFRSSTSLEFDLDLGHIGIEQTLLRSRPILAMSRPAGTPTTDPAVAASSATNYPWIADTIDATGEGQMLFDARVSANHEMDYHTRNRILAKISNNTTTKSHVFFVWVAVGYFEAHQNAAGYTQIGAQMTDVPVHRSISVVDMTRLEEAYDPYTGVFDYSKFVTHRKRLR